MPPLFVSGACTPARLLFTSSLMVATSCLLAPLAVHAAPTTAAESAAADSPTIEETMLVLGSRTPVRPQELIGGATYIDTTDLADARVPFVADLLRTIPTLNTSRAGGPGALTQVRTRGSEGNHSLVLLDGFELNDPATGSEYDFAHLRGTTVSAVEILPGPSGALWGSDALAGAIGLRSPTAGDDGWTTGLRLAGGEHGTLEATGQIGHGGERHGINLVLDRYQTDGTNVAEAGGERDGYSADTLALRAHLDVTNALRLSTTIRHLDATVEFDPSPFPAFTPADGDLETDLRRTLIGVRMDHDADNGFRHSLGAEALTSDYDDRSAGVRTNGREGERHRAFAQSAIDYAGVLPGEQRLTLVGEIERERFSQDGAASPFGDPNQDQELRHRSMLVEWRWQAPGDVRISATARRDWNQAFDDANHYRLGARAPLPAELGDAWVTVSTGTKNPGFVERFGFTPDTFAGNPELQPERSRSVEAGWQRSFADERYQARVIWHRSRLEDEINGFAFDPVTSLFTAANRDQDSRREGVEASLRFNPAAHTSLSLRYAFLDASEPDATGQAQEIRRPRHAAGMNLTHRPSYLPLTLRMDLSYVGERDDQDFGTFPATVVKLDDFVLMDAVINWRLGNGLDAFVRADNLLARNYTEVFGFATPGRTLRAGFEYRMR